MKHFLLLLSFLFLLTACSSSELPPSIIAKVNGRYISLEDLKEMHEVQTVSWELPTPPTFEETRLEYADVLLEMIITSLMEDELKKNNISVSDMDVQKELDFLQNDYTPEEFEKMLTENYIEVKGWKAQLRARLILDTFLNTLLRPQITITLQEIESFYEQNKESFKRSSSVRIYIISSTNRQMLERVQADIKKNIPIAEIRKKYEIVTVDELFTLEENLPEKLSSTLRKGDFTRIRKDGNDFISLYLLDRFPAGIPPLKSIYVTVEQQLIEGKLDLLYEKTINSLLEKTTLEIAPSLKSYISIQEIIKKSSNRNKDEK